MARVYISSTFTDLEAERRACRDAIRDLGHFPVGMEDYGAADERPLDYCLKDVRSCQTYVGIIAWKYGFCPGGGTKSITQLEYEEAIANKIPCFIFMLAEDALWARTRIPDSDQPQIRQFRQTLGNDHLVASFRDAASLVAALTKSLRKAEINNTAAPPLPDILPYLCDRSEQERDLVDAFTRFDASPSHPLVCIVHGDETEAHDKFLERLQRYMIPALRPRHTDQVDVQTYRLEWPAAPRNADDMRRRLQISLSRQVLDSSLETPMTVNARLAQALGPVAIHSHLITENWMEQGPQGLDAFMEFWKQWPELAVGQQLYIFLFIKYQMNNELGPFLRGKYRRINAKIREDLANYEFTRFVPVSGAVIAELIGPTRSEAEDWARSDYAMKFCNEDALVDAIGRYYTEWQVLQKPKVFPPRIPTDQLIPKLRELISRTLLPDRR